MRKYLYISGTGCLYFFCSAAVPKEYHDWRISFIVKVFENESGMVQLDFDSMSWSRLLYERR